jgi:quercetin dioxygenase-like cupin family protein
MITIRRAALGAALLGAAVVGAVALPSAAQQPQITSESHCPRSGVTVDVDVKLIGMVGGKESVVVHARDPSRTQVARFTVQPGGRFPWHTHPGPVIVNVTQGELVYVDGEDCSRHSYAAGTAFVDPGHGHAHTAYNPTGAPAVLVATFFEAPPAPAPLLILTDAPKDCDV